MEGRGRGLEKGEARRGGGVVGGGGRVEDLHSTDVFPLSGKCQNRQAAITGILMAPVTVTRGGGWGFESPQGLVERHRGPRSDSYSHCSTNQLL